MNLSKVLLSLHVALLPFSAVATNSPVTTSAPLQQATPLPIAVVPFLSAEKQVPDFAQIVENDLVRSAAFRGLDHRYHAKLGVTTEPTAETFAALRSMGVPYLVHGEITSGSVRFFLRDSATGEAILGFESAVTNSNQMRGIAHSVSDAIHQKLTGVPGVARTKLVYISKKGDGAAAQFMLVVADSDGADPRIIATSRAPLMSPDWSPDRTKLAFVGYEGKGSALYVQTLASGMIRKVSAESGINSAPAFSPDGRQLAYTLSIDGNPEIYIQDLESGMRRRLTDHPGIDTEAAWSPDGKQIAFTSDRLSVPRVFIMDTAGGEPRPLAALGKQSLQPTFAPDGKTIAMTVNDDGRYRIALFTLSDNASRYISDGPFDEGPSFSPNGRSLVFSSAGSDGRNELCIAAVNGPVRMRMRDGGSSGEPAWSPLAP